MVEPGVRHSGQCVDLRDAARYGANSRTACEPAVRIGDISGGLLITRVDQAHAAVARRIEERIEAVPAQRRHPVHAALPQTPDEQLRRGQ